MLFCSFRLEMFCVVFVSGSLVVRVLSIFSFELLLWCSVVRNIELFDCSCSRLGMKFCYLMCGLF